MDETRITHSESPRWFWIAAIWCGIGLFDATQTVFVMRAEGMHHYWARLFLTLLLSWLPWLAGDAVRAAAEPATILRRNGEAHFHVGSASWSMCAIGAVHTRRGSRCGKNG